MEGGPGGAGDGTRTRKGFHPMVFETIAFTSFATPAREGQLIASTEKARRLRSRRAFQVVLLVRRITDGAAFPSGS